MFSAGDCDSRKHKRLRTIKSGSIVNSDEQRLADCIVFDVSEGGAKLQTDIPIDCLGSFELILLDGSSFECSVVWHRANLLGVAFVRPLTGAKKP